jgi:hypothetical protein
MQRYDSGAQHRGLLHNTSAGGMERLSTWRAPLALVCVCVFYFVDIQFLGLFLWLRDHLGPLITKGLNKTFQKVFRNCRLLVFSAVSRLCRGWLARGPHARQPGFGDEREVTSNMERDKSPLISTIHLLFTGIWRSLIFLIFKGIFSAKFKFFELVSPFRV